MTFPTFTPTQLLEAIENYQATHISKYRHLFDGDGENNKDEVKTAIAKTRSKIADLYDSATNKIIESRSIKHPFYFRIQKREIKDPNDLNEFWGPPTKKSKLSRCNLDHKPLLYLTNNITCACEEVNLTPNDEVYLTIYCHNKSAHPANSSLNLICPYPLEHNPKSPNRGYPLFEGEAMTCYQILRLFLKNEFTQEVTDTTRYLYITSAALCSYLEELNCVSPTHGFLYPSTKTPEHHCLAIKPTYEKVTLEIKEIRKGVFRGYKNSIADFSWTDRSIVREESTNWESTKQDWIDSYPNFELNLKNGGYQARVSSF